MELLDEGNPNAYYERIALTDEEARERVNRTGDPDAADLSYHRREPLPWEEPDATLRKDTQIIRYSYADGRCYTQRGEALPDEVADEARRRGLVPSGTAADDESLKELIASCEPLVHEEDITLVDMKEGDDD